MTLDMSIRDIIQYLQTPVGRLILQGFMVFLVSEFVFRGILKQWVGLLLDMPRKQEKLIADTIALFLNIILGSLVGTFIFIDQGPRAIIGNTWWIVCFSFLFHWLYIKYLDKIIKKKYGVK